MHDTSIACVALSRFYFRIRDCWNRPISSAPAAGSTRVMTRKAASDGVTLVYVLPPPLLFVRQLVLT